MFLTHTTGSGLRLTSSNDFGYWTKRCHNAVDGSFGASQRPATGVVFAVAFGTIGIVSRLPKDILDRVAPEEAPRAIAGNPGQTFDIGPAGPEWRFLRRAAPAAAWCLAAYGFASVP